MQEQTVIRLVKAFFLVLLIQGIGAIALRSILDTTRFTQVIQTAPFP